MVSYLNQSSLTRGFRNNNPGNVKRSGDAWKGKISFSNSKDSVFEQFTHIEYGIRCLFAIMRTYRNKHGIKTIKAFVQRFAPAVENNESSYSAYLSQELGYSTTATLPDTKEFRIKMAKAIIEYENGVNIADQYLTAQMLNNGYELLYSGNTTTTEAISVDTPAKTKVQTVITCVVVIMLTAFAFKI